MDEHDNAQQGFGTGSSMPHMLSRVQFLMPKVLYRRLNIGMRSYAMAIFFILVSFACTLLRYFIHCHAANRWQPLIELSALFCQFVYCALQYPSIGPSWTHPDFSHRLYRLELITTFCLLFSLNLYMTPGNNSSLIGISCTYVPFFISFLAITLSGAEEEEALSYVMMEELNWDSPDFYGAHAAWVTSRNTLVLLLPVVGRAIVWDANTALEAIGNDPVYFYHVINEYTELPGWAKRSLSSTYKMAF